MEPFSVQVHRSGGHPTLLVFTGELDMAGALTLSETLGAHAGGVDGARLEVDCSAWSFVDAAGVRALLAWADRADRVALHGLRPPVAHVLELCGAMDAFDAGVPLAS